MLFISETDGRPLTADRRRLAPRPTEIIDRQQPVHFTFDGKWYAGYEGDTISAALWAHGVRMLSRSFKYHRPRGDFTFDGSGPNALVNADGEPNVRAGRRRITDGLHVRSQQGIPSLRFDAMAVNGLLHRFLPAGFYYKAFHTKSLWPLYEKFLRHVAGLGRVDPTAMPGDRYDQQHRHADVLVVGAGPAGLSAALAAADAGARVVIVEQERFLGGRLRYHPGEVNGQPYVERAGQLIDALRNHESIEVLSGTVAMGRRAYDDHWVPAFTDRRFYKIRCRALVVATGALDRTLVFSNNDLPGILTASAAARLLNLYAVPPGNNVLVVSANDEGVRLALELWRAGIAVLLAEERQQSESDMAEALQAEGVPVRWRHTISAAEGSRHVTGARLLPLQPDGIPPDRAGGMPASARDIVEVPCDTIVLAVGYTPRAGLLYQSGADITWDPDRREMLPVTLPRGVFAAGGVSGSHDVSTALLEGQVAGAAAAAEAGFGTGVDEEGTARLAALKAGVRFRTTRYYSIPGPGPFRFVDLSEDVTEKDLQDAIAEGYDSIELVKRYTTISMGPDQGRYSSLNTVLLTAEVTGRTVAETGTTTSRPPTFPVKMGVLRGRHMDPLRRTPLHHWHEGYGCRWLNAGSWRRPEEYHAHTPEQEVLAVRHDVGIIDVSTLGKLRLYGKDVPELLHRLYTNKWRVLPIGAVRYGVMCTEAGTFFDDGVCARLSEQEYYMTTSTANSSAVPEHIHWWLEQPGWDLDVHVVNVTAAYAAINVAGPRSRELISRLAEGIDLSNEAFPFMAVRACRLAGVDALLLRIGFTGELSYEAHVPVGYAEHVWMQLLEQGQDLGVMPFALEAQGILRLEKGHVIGQDLDALASPLETDLAWAVKFDKDDFVGKTACVRKMRKGLTRALVGFTMDDPAIVPPEGTLVVEEAPGGDLTQAGWVTSARFSPTLERSIGLAWVPAACQTPDTPITIWVEEEPHQAHVAELPFYDPEGKALRR